MLDEGHKLLAKLNQYPRHRRIDPTQDDDPSRCAVPA